MWKLPSKFNAFKRMLSNEMPSGSRKNDLCELNILSLLPGTDIKVICLFHIQIYST